MQNVSWALEVAFNSLASYQLRLLLTTVASTPVVSTRTVVQTAGLRSCLQLYLRVTSSLPVLRTSSVLPTPPFEGVIS
jgi:hypothetical protein